jgi:EF hand
LSAASADSEAYDGSSPEDEYNNIDTDKDGKLSRQEVEAFYASYEQDVPDEFWQELDQDGDGFISMDASTLAQRIPCLLALLDAFSLLLLYYNLFVHPLIGIF